MEELKVYVREKPQESYDWNTNTVQFENGVKQYQQTWTKPEIIVNFQTEGLKDYIEGIIKFFNDRCGMLEPFYCDIYKNGNKKIYRFNSPKLEPEWNYNAREGKISATLNISLIEVKQ